MESDPLRAAREAAGAGRAVPATTPPPTGAAPEPVHRSSATEVFDAILRENPELFKGNREILRETYIPSRLPHREHQIRQVAEVLAPALKGTVPSNLL
ncbi:MAG: hypothetical protein L3K05_01200, partial [Thermoplasmata archaeon]|nr:hypothetical protein [Thermoplasmata archaeon]